MANLAQFDLMTIAEVAEALHCSKAHVGKAVAGRVPGCNPIPCVSLGRRRLVRRSSLLVWLEESERNKLSASPESRSPVERRLG